MDVYSEWVAKPESEIGGGALVSFSVQYPLLFHKDGITYSAHPVNSNADGSMDFGAAMSPGMVLELGEASVNGLIAEAGNAVYKAAQGVGQPKAIVLAHCGGRAIALGDRIREIPAEVEHAVGHMPLIGYLAFGEQGVSVAGHSHPCRPEPVRARPRLGASACGVSGGRGAGRRLTGGFAPCHPRSSPHPGCGRSTRRITMAVATRRYQNYVNGRFVDAQGGKTLTVENPATGAAVSDVPDSSVEDAREAIEFADRAQRQWEKLAPIERADYLHRIAAGIRKDAEHLARVLSEEQGKPLDQARGEVNGTAELLRLHRGVGPPYRGRGHRQRPAERDGAAAPAAHRRHRRDRALELPALRPRAQGGAGPPDGQRDRREAERDHAEQHARARPHLRRGGGARRSRQPRVRLRTDRRRGAGLEPAHRHGDRHGQHQDGLPGHGARRAEHHEGEPGARRQRTRSSSCRTPTWTWRSGPSRPAASSTRARCAAQPTGPTSTRASRDEFTDRLATAMGQATYGNALVDEGRDLGPLVSARQLEAVSGRVERAVADGGQIVIGGKRAEDKPEGHYYPATVIANCRQDMAIVREEIFGPVMPVVTFNDLDEAIAWANDSIYGLASSIFTKNVDVVMRACNELRFGETYVNRENMENMQGFHAGWRKSGIGGADGKHGVLEYTRTHVVYLQYDMAAGRP